MILTNNVAICRPIVLAMAVLLAVSACETETPPVPEALYVQLLIEASLMQAVFNVNHDSVITSSIFESVLAHYEVDKWDFLQSHRIYQLDLEAQQRRWAIVVDSVTAQSRRLAEP